MFTEEKNKSYYDKVSLKNVPHIDFHFFNKKINNKKLIEIFVKKLHKIN